MTALRLPQPIRRRRRPPSRHASVRAPSARAWSGRARRRSSAIPVARSSRSTTSSASFRFATSSFAMSRVPPTPPTGSAGQRRASGSHRDVRSGRDQPRHRPRDRDDGLGPDGGDHRQRRALLGKDAFQETDIVGIALPVTKYATVVMDPDEVPLAIAEAFEIARSGAPRPGPARLPEGRAADRDDRTAPRAARAPVARAAATHPRRRPRGRRAGRDDRQVGAPADPERPRGADRRRHRPAAPGRGARRDPGRAHAARHRQHRRDAPAERRLRRHARMDARQQGAPALRPADRGRMPVRRPHHRQDVDARAAREDRPCRRRSLGDRQERPHRSRHRRRCGRPAGRAPATTAPVGGRADWTAAGRMA